MPQRKGFDPTRRRRRRDRGGTVFRRRSDGRWGAQVSRGGRERREIWREYVPPGAGSGQKAGERLLRQMQDALQAGLWRTFDVPADTTLVGPFLHDWNHNHRPRKVQEERLSKVERTIDLHIVPTLVTLDGGARVALGDMTVSSVGSHHVVELLEALALKTTKRGGEQVPVTSVKQVVYDTLRMAWDYAVISRRATTNVVAPVRRPQTESTKPELWSDDEMLAFLESPLVTADRYHASYWLAAYPGIRESEILGLQWKHVDLDGSAVQVVQQLARRKGAYVLKRKLKADPDGEWRIVWPEAVDSLRRHRDMRITEVGAAGVEWSEDQLVFVTERGQPVNASAWYKHFHLLAGKIGVPLVKPHSLRHKASTADNRAGVDPNTRMLQRGRTSMETERAVYIHPDLADQRRGAAEARRVMFEQRAARAKV